MHWEKNNSEIINMPISHSKYDIAMQTPIPKPVIYVPIQTTSKPYAWPAINVSSSHGLNVLLLLDARMLCFCSLLRLPGLG